MRAAVLLLLGCKLPDSDQRPVDESPPVEDTPPWGPPALQVAPDAVDFGVVDLGDHVATSIELANVGGDDLVVNELRLEYEDPTIELDWGGREELAPGASARTSLTWSPTRAQDLKSKLRIGSNDPVAPMVAVWLTGATTTPQIEVDPTAVDLGDVLVGSEWEQQFAIRNVGHADLEIESVVFLPSDPDDLKMKPIETPLVVLPGTEVEATIQWAPTDEGEDHGILTLQSNDPMTPEIHAELVGAAVAGSDTGT